jgi:hypothetical protein
VLNKNDFLKCFKVLPKEYKKVDVEKYASRNIKALHNLKLVLRR